MYKMFIKYFFDFILSVLILPFVLVIIIIVGVFIRLEDGGPIFYNAYRTGKNGKSFKMYKLRSMKVNAPDIRLSDGSTFNSENDERVTKVGKFIRKTSLDEFPQIINVLKGEMSFVGPRPDPIDLMEFYPSQYLDFLKARPGITGYSQAYFRNSVDGLTKMKHDLFYQQNYSFLFDVKILLKTLQAVIFSKNINRE